MNLKLIKDVALLLSIESLNGTRSSDSAHYLGGSQQGSSIESTLGCLFKDVVLVTWPSLAGKL